MLVNSMGGGILTQKVHGYMYHIMTFTLSEAFSILEFCQLHLNNTGKNSNTGPFVTLMQELPFPSTSCTFCFICI